jgi:hypothetical protein
VQRRKNNEAGTDDDAGNVSLLDKVQSIHG